MRPAEYAPSSSPRLPRPQVLAWLVDIKLCCPEVGSREVQILLLCLSTFFRYWYLYLSICFSDNLLLLLPTLEHKYLYFLLLIFSEQALHCSLNAFAFLTVLKMLYKPKMSLFDILGGDSTISSFSGVFRNSLDKSY